MSDNHVETATMNKCFSFFAIGGYVNNVDGAQKTHQPQWI